MTPEQYAHIQQIFLRLRELPSHEQRVSELAKLDNTLLTQEVASLLAADENIDGFLEPHGDRENSLTEQPETDLHVQSDRPQPPRRVGRYRLLQQIGEGGFGSVYMAQQTESLHRQVAVKLIKPGMDSKQVLSRFHAERQALAMMDHPSIAKVLDAGTADSGVPYFVMELVKGAPIHDFAESQQLSLRERLELFVQVCSAVHHAHQKGVIHRDLKPSNILVTMSEDGPLAKVIDFGIAKALDSRLTEHTVFTEFGQMVGTLEYMSPEQAEMSSLDIDTRSDVYSLGVLLYQLLTGEPPLSREQLLKDGVWEVHRRIRDTEPPPPSTRVTGAQDQLLRAHDVDSAPRRGLRNLKGGDLDWITMKALAKQRRRRYDSAGDLGRDVQRYLAGQPVDAHPPSSRYQLEMFVKRHRAFAAVFVTIFASVVMGLLVSLWGLSQVRVARDEAIENEQLARAAQERADQQAVKLAETMYSEMVTAAWQAAARNDFPRARTLLDSCLPQWRGWEWEFVQQDVAARSQLPLRAADQSAVIEFDVQESRGLVACVLEGGTVELRRLERNELIETIDGAFRANAVRFAPDGSALYIGTMEGELVVWNIKDRVSVASKQLLQGGIYDVQLTADGSQVAICTGGSWVNLLETGTLASTAKWKLPARLGNLLLRDSGTEIVGSGLDGQIYLMRVGAPEYEQWFVAEASLHRPAWLDEDRVAMLTGQTAVAVNIRTPDVAPTELMRMEGSASALAVARGGQVIAVGAGDGRLQVADSQGGSSEEVAKFDAAIRATQWLPDRDEFLLALSDGRLLTAQPRAEEVGRTFRSRAPVSTGALLSKRSMAVTLDDRGWLRAWDLADGSLLKELRAHSDSAWGISVDAEENLLTTVGEDMHLCCWELPALKLRFRADIDWGVRDVCLAPSGSWIAAAPPAEVVRGQQEGVIGLWNTSTGKCESRLSGHTNWVTRLAVSPDGRHLVSGSANRTTRVWDIKQSRLEYEFSSPKQSAAQHYAFAHQPARLFIGHRDGQITAWNLADGSHLGAWTAFGDALSGLAITGDERLIATSQSDSRLKIWAIDNDRRVLAEFDLGLGYIKDFRLSLDDRNVSIATPNALVVRRSSR